MYRSSKSKKTSCKLSPKFDGKNIEKDPADDEFIIAAIEGQADYIVSGNQHLLALGSYEKIKIVTPKEFSEILDADTKK